jgi:hypothetical protein
MEDAMQARMKLLAGAACLMLAMQAPGLAAESQIKPAPSQSGQDPSMAPPTESSPPVLDKPQPPDRPEGTVGLAPADQPVNNANPYVGGQVIPSSQATAAHDQTILKHDHQPILAHTFNFTREQKRAVIAALAPDDKADIGTNITVSEAALVPDVVKLYPLPEGLVQQMPWLGPYLYAKSGGRIILVDANLRYVAAIIE